MLFKADRGHERDLGDSQGPQPQHENLTRGHLFPSVFLDAFTDNVQHWVDRTPLFTEDRGQAAIRCRHNVVLPVVIQHRNRLSIDIWVVLDLIS